jgi:hypothetical protein
MNISNTKYYDVQGQERDQTWLENNFGPVVISGHSDVFEVKELRENLGQPTMTVTIRDALGHPIEGREVFFGWPDGLVSGMTDGGGAVGFGLGPGATYWPPEQGPHFVIFDGQGHRDEEGHLVSVEGGLRIDGLGVAGNTNWRLLLPTYQIQGDSPPEPPPAPPPEPLPEGCEARWALLLDKLDEVIALLEAAT